MKEQQREAAGRGAALERTRFAGLEPADMHQERIAVGTEKRAAFARAANLELGSLGPKKSDLGKVLLASAMKRATSVSNGWLAERRNMGEPASVSQFVRRCLPTETGRNAVERLLAKAQR